MAEIRTTFHGRLSAITRQTSLMARTMARAQLEAASGLRYQKASDDPARTTQVHRVREQAQDVDVFVGNASWATSVHSAADEALSGMSNALAEARQLAVQLGNDTYNDQTRVDSVITGQAVLERVLIFANTNLGGRYIFAGNSYNNEAYDTATGAYLGDAGQPVTEVGNGLTVATGFDGSALLQGGGDIITAIQDLVTALGTGNADDVRATIDGIDDAVDQLSQARTTIGGQMTRSDDSLEINEGLRVHLGQLESDLTNADSIQAYTRLFEVQTAFEAALAVTASSRGQTLFSRM
jgi:flagellar hook-associated protein 3 FlgL